MTERAITRIAHVTSLAEDDGAAFGQAFARLVATTSADDGSDGALDDLRAIAEALPVTVFAIDPNDTLRYCFGGGLRSLGMTEDELRAFPVALFGDDATATLRRVRAEREAGAFDIEGHTGDRRWSYHVQVSPPGLDGSIHAVALDTTDRLVIEEELAERSVELRATEARLRLLAEEAPIGIFLGDGNGRMLYANRALQELFGRTAAELYEGWIDHIHPDDRNWERDDHPETLAREGTVIREFRVVRPDGSTVWARARVASLTDERGEPAGTVGSFADTTEFVEARAQLAEREERTRAILETAAEGIVTVDERGVVLEFNAAAERILGYDSDEVVGRCTFDRFLTSDHRDVLLDAYAAYRETGAAGWLAPGAREVELVRQDGVVVPVELAVTDVTTSAGVLFTGVFHDVSERRAFERELEHQATHDPLTGLPNRALLAVELDAALNRAARHHTGLAVLFVELGRLKLVSTTLGHRAADQVIAAAARRITRLIDQWSQRLGGEEATVARFGGNHFVVVAEDLAVADAVLLAEDLVDALVEPFPLGGDEALVRPAVGVSYSDDGRSTPDTLLANADVAMTRARTVSAGGYEVYDAEMRRWVERRRTLEVELRHGIERNEFELYYQPVVELATGRIAGFESLVRWNHPERGVLAPAEFIPLAEETGLIVPLGRWILEAACRQLAVWQASFPDAGLRVSVNLSGRQLAQTDLPDLVGAALQDAGATVDGLELEITETVLLEDVGAVVATLDALKATGVLLAMDDFGTGYSSLTYLCRLPIDVVKIDRSFVSQLGTPSRDASVVSLVVGMAHTLELDVVAEGVETDEQVRHLEELDCAYVQGYLYAKPLPAADAELLLEDGLRFAR